MTRIRIVGTHWINEGKSRTYQARGVFSNGQTAILGDPNGSTADDIVTWEGSSPGAQVHGGTVVTSEIDGGNQFFDLTATYTFRGVTKTGTKSVTIIDAQTRNTTKVVITGEPYPNECGTYSYTATASFNDGSEETVTDDSTWTEPTQYADFGDPAGTLTTSEVDGNQVSSVKAQYTFNGVTSRLSRK